MTLDGLVGLWEAWDTACPDEDRRPTRRRLRAAPELAGRRDDREQVVNLGWAAHDLEDGLQEYAREHGVSANLLREAVAQGRREGLSARAALQRVCA